MQRSFRAALTAALVLALGVGMMGTASAEDKEPSGVAINPDAILATPEEVAMMGSPPDVVEAQERAWEQMSAGQIDRQETLRAIEGEIEVPEVVATIDPQVPSAGLRAVVSCQTAAGLYALQHAWFDTTTCFRGKGTTEISGGLMVSRLYPGNNLGRVYFMQGRTMYYSVQRGPDFSWHTFADWQNSPVTVYAVIITAAHI